MKKPIIDARLYSAVDETVNSLTAILESSEGGGSKSPERVQFLALSMILDGDGLLDALNSYARWGRENEISFDRVRRNCDQRQDAPDLPSLEQLESGR